ncbi:hypothetical protein RhiJN_13039 [Ceratobasidium sp. AG-Ba]|nr:hypothetical protein RhiJN_13039 [Ceratobasidium sp. AG-Ba]
MRCSALGLGILSLILFPEKSQCIRLTTWNLRYDSQPDNVTVADTLASLPNRLQEPTSFYPDASRERPWSLRRVGVAALLEFQAPTIISFQEALVRQVQDLKELLGEDWDWNSRNAQTWDTFWLSDTPFDVSKYPGAGSYRICTVAHFDISGKNFTLLNTHFDDQSMLNVDLPLH